MIIAIFAIGAPILLMLVLIHHELKLLVKLTDIKPDGFFEVVDE